MLLKAGTFGVCKINIDTDLRLAMTASIRKHLATNPAYFDPRQYLKPAREAWQQFSDFFQTGKISSGLPLNL